LTGLADQCLHDVQWQYPIASGAPLISNFTAPQKQLPEVPFMGVSFQKTTVDARRKGLRIAFQRCIGPST
jgi:hypothetical protein